MTVGFDAASSDAAIVLSNLNRTAVASADTVNASTAITMTGKRVWRIVMNTASPTDLTGFTDFATAGAYGVTANDGVAYVNWSAVVTLTALASLAAGDTMEVACDFTALLMWARAKKSGVWTSWYGAGNLVGDPTAGTNGIPLGTVTTPRAGSWMSNGHSITADFDTIELPGFTSVAGTAFSYSLTSALGTFVETGQTAALKASRVATADAGTYLLAGQDAGLTRTFTALGAGVGAFTHTGQTATLRRGTVFAASSGALALTGQVATFRRHLVLSAQAAAITLGSPSIGFGYIVAPVVAFTPGWSAVAQTGVARWRPVWQPPTVVPPDPDPDPSDTFPLDLSNATNTGLGYFMGWL